MTPTIYLWLAKFAIAMAFVGIIFAFGYKVAEDKLQPEINTLAAKLETIDLKAKEDEIKAKEIANVIKNKDDKYRAAISYYERMLSEAANRTRTGEAAKDTAGVDASPGQSTITGCPVEAESRCLADARVRAGMAEFFKINAFPIAD